MSCRYIYNIDKINCSFINIDILSEGKYPIPDVAVHKYYKSVEIDQYS